MVEATTLFVVKIDNETPLRYKGGWMNGMAQIQLEPRSLTSSSVSQVVIGLLVCQDLKRNLIKGIKRILWQKVEVITLLSHLIALNNFL